MNLRDTSSWAPAGETAADLWNERSYLIGLFLGAVAYGIHLTLFVMCFQLLYSGKRNKQDLLMLLYISLLFTLGSLGNATNIKFGEMTYVDHRDYPGGPSAYFVEQSINPIAVICNSAYIVNTWLQDGLLLYRFYIFGLGNVYLIIVPVLMFFASVVLSLFLIVELCKPGITIWSKISVNLGIPYWSISIALNVIITVFISVRLLHMRHKLQQVLSKAGNKYLTITAMIIESAALYTVNGLILLITYALNNPVQNLALPMLGQTQSIAPLLIILRVVQGRAWSTETAQSFGARTTSGTEMQFRSGLAAESSETTTVIGAAMSHLHLHDMQRQKISSKSTLNT